jgi:hypothetical protein
MRVKVVLIDDEGNETQSDESNETNEDKATILFKSVSVYMYMEMIGLSNANQAG